jgi:hypothetical protein
MEKKITSLNQLLKHSPHCHPVTKKRYNFGKDEYAWYWIYLKNGSIFNTYDWYVVSSGSYYSCWKNFYYAGDPDHKGLRIKNKQIKKVVCWKIR